MSKLIIDLTDVTRLEFEVLRVQFPIEDGEPVPAVESTVRALRVQAAILSTVSKGKDPSAKSRLSTEELKVPRRHQRKIAAACLALVHKLKRYQTNEYLLLMNLVGLSNRLCKEHGEASIDDVFSVFNIPMCVDESVLIPSRPSNPEHTQLVQTVDRLVEELESFSSSRARPF